ncbi:MAG: VOC family protein [Gemmatimonadales bacterium]
MTEGSEATDRPPNYRLPPSARIGRITLRVADVARSAAWYERTIGLVRLAHDGNRATMGGANGAELVVLDGVPGSNPVARRGQLGLYHFAVLLPTRADLGRFARQLRSIGERVGAADHEVSEALYLTDPDGHGVEVYADRPASSWKHVNAQLAMSTESLDLAELMDAGGEEAWNGAPPSTVIGHVHLRVADIERAEAFYRQALGFERTVWSYTGALFLAAGGYHHHVGLNAWSPGALRPGPDDARLLEWELIVPAHDASAILTNVLRAGGTVSAALAGGIALDPWGTAVRISPGA